MTRYFKYGETKGSVDCIIEETDGRFKVHSKAGVSDKRHSFAFDKVHSAEADIVEEKEAKEIIDGFGSEISKAFSALGL